MRKKKMYGFLIILALLLGVFVFAAQNSERTPIFFIEARESGYHAVYF